MRTRNAFFLCSLLASVALAGCSTAPVTASNTPIQHVATNQIFSDGYGPVEDHGYALPAIPINRVDQRFHRQIIDYATNEPVGTIVVNTPNRFLYYVLPGGKAVRYGIGVGKQGFAWQGRAYVAWKQEWPTWHPPKEMAQRRPDVAQYVEAGMGPGLRNPLGARALYLFNDEGKDTLFRLHGTPEWNSIGTAASSGCIRLMNQDIIDLYSRVRPGKSTLVVVQQ
ncbi:lipoprotein-anchoring transpeptidase ErfK/SrfK [Rhizobium sp. PP-F2F-G38]|uniref:L,D-transpeptidase n=1 Tax=Ferranicluibacter rubi TaxID=2715133 RepID=A0AA44CAL9_9HYPH|nr:L,D-transpeptidase [Ferranicluibacter rubi]PYE33159.1 lipoprotein-anchoring transpeptidase ErfK/SrfK [Rhizobium sp. PP-WC-1G-195]PYE97208.1 lipoprotein-anchoring transpeptidase ErfK/SrfK [Rhizobium sp. PP-F2F-G38]TCP87623.1 lipoprotein-anchoring transpeptidase ErfK/SrfK [Rhizobium sp. PP-CC-2G-626]TCQ07000.1 lipoprotein-anchoring transpeptidase ErfK/SrfK [Rhizobium sp. PP-F2F-G36]TCQ25187.1 lipoprotein-anchoring transpeptidase ErfK/SrfK [Rhizobium sp. PP-CC-3G-465]